MPSLFEQMVRVARRSRKCHLGPVFNTQSLGACDAGAAASPEGVLRFAFDDPFGRARDSVA
jgi:hypothetical protein